MKLLKKTNKTYFIISALAFVVAGVIIYSALSFIFEDQLREKLMSDMEKIVQTIERDNAVPSYYPFVEVRKVPGKTLKPVVSSDTLIFDDSEKENIPFRQISSVRSIKGEMYSIVVRDTLLEKSDLLMIIVIVISLVFVLLAISLYFINRKFSLKIWKPFYSTLNDLRGFSPGDVVFKLSEASEIDEFAELNTTLEKLTSKVISDYQSLKRFTEDASHEIQTPLAVIQSKLETLFQHPELKKEQAELIKSAYTSVQRISKLTQTLLLLTKISNDQFPEKGQVNLSELLEEKVKLFEDHFNSKSLILQKEVEPEIYLETNFFLAESMVMNLVGNAVKHSDKEGIINILLDKHCLEISNTGSPLPVPPEKLFERFYKIDKSTDSHGLGLAIVREICKLYEWEISYQYTDHIHKFIISF
jgi:two-component system, OmpR family, sensor kinase